MYISRSQRGHVVRHKMIKWVRAHSKLMNAAEAARTKRLQALAAYAVPLSARVWEISDRALASKPMLPRTPPPAPRTAARTPTRKAVPLEFDRHVARLAALGRAHALTLACIEGQCGSCAETRASVSEVLACHGTCSTKVGMLGGIIGHAEDCKRANIA